MDPQLKHTTFLPELIWEITSSETVILHPTASHNGHLYKIAFFHTGERTCDSVRVHVFCNTGHVLSVTNERGLSNVIHPSSARFPSKHAHHYPNVSMSPSVFASSSGGNQARCEDILSAHSYHTERVLESACRKKVATLAHNFLHCTGLQSSNNDKSYLFILAIYYHKIMCYK